METLKNARIEIPELLSENEAKRLEPLLKKANKYLDKRIGEYKEGSHFTNLVRITSIKLALIKVVDVETTKIDVEYFAECAGIALYRAFIEGVGFSFEIAINLR